MRGIPSSVSNQSNLSRLFRQMKDTQGDGKQRGVPYQSCGGLPISRNSTRGSSYKVSFFVLLALLARLRVQQMYLDPQSICKSISFMSNLTHCMGKRKPFPGRTLSALKGKSNRLRAIIIVILVSFPSTTYLPSPPSSSWKSFNIDFPCFVSSRSVSLSFSSFEHHNIFRVLKSRLTLIIPAVLQHIYI